LSPSIAHSYAKRKNALLDTSEPTLLHTHVILQSASPSAVPSENCHHRCSCFPQLNLCLLSFLPCEPQSHSLFYLHIHLSLLSLHKKLPCFSIFISKKTGQSHIQSSAPCCSTPCACHCSTVQFRKTPGTR